MPYQVFTPPRFISKYSIASGPGPLHLVEHIRVNLLPDAKSYTVTMYCSGHPVEVPFEYSDEATKEWRFHDGRHPEKGYCKICQVKM